MLFQNSPNPFDQTTQIKFGLPKPQSIILKLYDNTGKTISTLAEGQFTEGWHFVNLEVKDLSSGVYMYRLDSESGNRVEKMLVVK